jgi:ABC-type Fe3+ transport system permease subunit
VGVASALIAAGQIVKYTIPGRRLRTDGVPNRSLVVGGLVAVVGFFVVPVVGVLIGFVLGIYASEVQRVGARMAWPSTQAALRAVGVSMLLELTSTLLGAVVWMVGVTIT